jgi:hypothetical protein
MKTKTKLDKNKNKNKIKSEKNTGFAKVDARKLASHLSQGAEFTCNWTR